MAFDDHTGTNKLAKLLSQSIREGADKPAVIDYGEISSDLSLKTNTFPVFIPKSDYMVCEGAATKIKSGARVLVAWIGDDACVIDTVKSASSL